MLQELQLYAAQQPVLPPERAATWQLIGRGKLEMDKQLGAASVEMQNILQGWEQTTVDKVADLTAKLEVFRSKYLALVEKRKGFTKFLDLCKEQCMTVEKGFDPKTNAVYVSASNHELKLRKEATDNMNAAASKTSEEAAFIAHIKNELHRIVADYRAALKKIVHDAYVACLSQKTPAENILIAINAAVAAMHETKVGVLNKYPRKIVTDAEAIELFNKIPKPDFPTIYRAEMDLLKEKFSMYANDLASAEVVLQQQNVQFAAQQAEAATNLQTAQAATVLSEQALASTFATPSGIKPITEVSKIKIVDDNPKWVVAIMTAFTSNFQKCWPLVKVKKYSELKIAQMAAALDAAGVKVESDFVEYENITK